MEAIEHPPIFRLPGIPDHVTYTWLAMVILAVMTFVASHNLQLVPRGLQNFLEVVLGQFQSMIDDVMGHEGRRYLPLIATLGLFLLMVLDGLIGWALSGSVVGAVVGGIGGLVTIVFTVGFLYPLKILVAFLQAFIFVMLTMLYISGAIEEADHHPSTTSRSHV